MVAPDAKTHVVASVVKREHVGRANTRRVRSTNKLIKKFKLPKASCLREFIISAVQMWKKFHNSIAKKAD